MALLINKDVSILGELNSSQIYTRVNIRYGYKGNKLIVEPVNYVSRESYLSEPGMEVYKVNIDGIPKFKEFEYNNDGDILVASHNKLKEFLTTDITRDSSVLDPSTGEMINEITIITPKFCEESEISIIDISIN